MQENIKTDSNAFDLFPDIFGNMELSEQDLVVEKAREPESSSVMEIVCPEPEVTTTIIPPPPDISWLPGGLSEADSETELAVRQCLVFVSDQKKREMIAPALDELGFITSEAATAGEAIEKITCAAYPLVIGDIADVKPEFHLHMQWLPMTHRRTMYYTLIGPSLHTLYDLEALSLSANMVICDSDLVHISKILSRGFTEYEKLFRPLLEMMQSNFPPLI